MNITRIRNAVLAFYGGDPLVAWLLTFAFLTVLSALVVFASRIRRQPKAIANKFPRAS